MHSELPATTPFVDGNKRTAAVVSETFLIRNGYSLNATDAELVVTFQALAGGELEENELARWFREHLSTG
jgi:death on curing protein